MPVRVVWYQPDGKGGFMTQTKKEYPLGTRKVINGIPHICVRAGEDIIVKPKQDDKDARKV